MYFYKLSVVDNIAPDGWLPDVVIVRALRLQILKTGMKIESNFKLFENHLKTLILLSLDHSWSNIRKDFLYFKHFRGFGNLERVSFIFLDRIVPNFVFWRADFVSQLRSILEMPGAGLVFYVATGNVKWCLWPFFQADPVIPYGRRCRTLMPSLLDFY